jgi:hypothetical protein
MAARIIASLRLEHEPVVLHSCGELRSVTVFNGDPIATPQAYAAAVAESLLTTLTTDFQ